VDKQQELLSAIHDHDKRLIRLETQLEGVHVELKSVQKEINRNAEIASKALEQITQLAIKVADLAASHRMLLRVITGFGVLIAGLEAWTVFQ